MINKCSLFQRLVLAWVLGAGTSLVSGKDWVEYAPEDGPGKGRHIVMISGDEEYRSEEGLPMLGKILAKKHGFKVTVLFSINPDTGEIDPNNQTNIPGIEKLATADLMILLTRFRELPDKDMEHFTAYMKAGKPIIGIRTATHAFNYTRNKDSKYAEFDFGNGSWKGGFGQQVLGETWINHHGHHGQESTRGLIDGMNKDQVILKGVKDIWGDTDVYGVRNIPSTAKILVHGLSLNGMTPDSLPNYDKSLMPIIWTNTYEGKYGKIDKILCSTIGAATDLQCADLRLLFVNACYWATGLEDKITGKADVGIIGKYEPSKFGFNGFKKGVRPEDHEL